MPLLNDAIDIVQAFIGSFKQDPRPFVYTGPVYTPKASGEEAISHQTLLWDTVWCTLNTYFQDDNTMSLEDAITQVNQCWDETTIYETVVLRIPILIAQRTPYDSPTHGKLAEFMQALNDKRSEENHPYNKDIDSLGDFGIYVYDEFNFSHPHKLLANVADDGSPDPIDPLEYANFCAFLAQFIWANGEFCHFQARIALTYMTEINPHGPVAVRDAWVIGAAQFIIYQTPAIWVQAVQDRQWVEEELERERKFLVRLRLRRAKKIKRPDGHEFRWDGWQKWRRAFRAVAIHESYGETCRAVAQKAADLMTLQEKIEDENLERS